MRHEAKRAEKAAQTTREMHANRGGQPAGDTAGDGDAPVVERLLTRRQAVHARTVLDYVAAHSPHPEAEVRLVVLMLTLRAARAGTGNVTGQDLTGWLPDDAEQVLQQLIAADWLRLPGTVAASVMVVLAGIVWWKSRHRAWLPRLMARLWQVGNAPLGVGLALASLGSVLIDKQIDQHARQVDLDTIFNAALLIGGWLVCRAARDSDVVFTRGRWLLSFEMFFRPAAAACGVFVLLFLVRNPQTYPLLSDTENPLRLAGMLVGVLLAKAGGWRPRPGEPELVTRCRDHLYRLQTIQMSTNAISTGASQLLSLGSSHTTSVSTIPPNFPALVEDFRRLLTQIATVKSQGGEVVVIAIDEVDRLGSDTQALAFLSEVKAILGVPHVYYLISVSEDVGATFVRRGLPHRDVTDSSLDDILHVQPSTLKESLVILAKRAETLTVPYVQLAHALSGGILRDLLRYGLQVKEMQDKAQSFELTDISRHLILKELSETLAGFRTLLSKHQWTRDTSDILSTIRALGGHLRAPCPCTEAQMRHALEHFAFYMAGGLAHDELTDDARQLIDEASAYAYFTLTLLDIFSTEGLERRTRQAAENGPDGDPERLAEARRELGISPHSARPLIDSIRKAWSLSWGPTAHVPIPSPRPSDCTIHAAESDRPEPRSVWDLHQGGH
ncbi:hypothetical protein [Streptomyces werraensis]|uniref:hypothetical protein n=1 Tax=Streptomyces werraensis TaxID=68284 RepID=UPI00380A2447